MRSERATLLIGIPLVLVAVALHSAPDEMARTTGSFDQQPVAASVVISEVLFDPSPGDSPFLELLNASASPVDMRGMALKLGDVLLPLARVLTPLPAGAHLLVQFDGGAKVEGLTYHAPTTFTVNAPGGAAELIDERNTSLDRIAWGNAAGGLDAVDDLTGARKRGRTLGRGPNANEPFVTEDWTIYDPEQATPGTANPLAPIPDLLPDDGDMIDGPGISLDWWSVPGAASYHYQVTQADDQSFARVVSQATVTDLGAKLSSLPPAKYIWRVQPIDKTGAAGSFSRIAFFGKSRAAEPLLSAETVAPLLPLKIATNRQAPMIGTANPLAVPYIEQHKDTGMLQLENPKQNHAHGWNVDHKVYDRNDPSDKYNCVLASIAMISKFLGGNLSQDRIGYEVLSRHGASHAAAIIGNNMSGMGNYRNQADIQDLLNERRPGPEWDLTWDDGPNSGLNPAQILAAIDFAFGGPGRTEIFQITPDILQRYPLFSPNLLDQAQAERRVWAAIKNEIDNRRPVIVSSGVGTTKHAVVIKGYEETGGQKVLVINNPADPAALRRVLNGHDFSRDAYYFLPSNPIPRPQETTVLLDSDGDGVVDFDETDRFHTDPHNRDTDGDGLEDGRIDIATGVFDPTYGHARHKASTRGRDYDGDGKPTELDPDSDDGGCKDGVEDADHDSQRTSPETWNFDERDDLCREVNGHITFEADFHGGVSGLLMFRHEFFTVSVAVKPKRQGQTGPLVDTGNSRYSFSTSLEEVVGQDGCETIARSAISGRGDFGRRPGDEIGGYLNNEGDEIIITAGGGNTGSKTVESCIGSGTDPWEDSASLPSCPGKRVGNTRTYRFNCTQKPPSPPGLNLTIDRYSTQGTVTLAPSPEPIRAWTAWERLLVALPGVLLPPHIDVAVGGGVVGRQQRH